MSQDGDDNFKKQKTTAEEDTKNKYGDDAAKYSASESGLGNGIVRERGIKDCLCLLIFLVALVAMGWCTVYGR